MFFSACSDVAPTTTASMPPWGNTGSRRLEIEVIWRFKFPRLIGRTATTRRDAVRAALAHRGA